jgi:hypothetical protein
MDLLIKTSVQARDYEMQCVAERISRLQRNGVIPRETAALMRTITEMRNAPNIKTRPYLRLKVAWFGRFGKHFRNGLLNAA